MTFEEWLGLWEASGHFHERGSRPDQYCMARNGDQGGYEVGNVRIVTCAENQAEQRERLGLLPWPRTGRQSLVQIGRWYFPTRMMMLKTSSAAAA